MEANEAVGVLLEDAISGITGGAMFQRIAGTEIGKIEVCFLGEDGALGKGQFALPSGARIFLELARCGKKWLINGSDKDLMRLEPETGE